MLLAITLSLALVLSSTPADLGPSPAVEEPAPVQCADARLAQSLAPIFLAGIGGPIAPTVTCTEDCDELAPIQCQGSNCSAVERNCSVGQRGYVVCDGNYTYCPEPCPVCVENDFRMVKTGECCDCYTTGGEITHYEYCVNGEWVTHSTACRGPSLVCALCG